MSTSDRPPVFVALLALVLGLAGCVTVKPQDRTILADPIMQIGAESPAHAQVNHALENREGANGGDGVSGGGCGCN